MRYLAIPAVMLAFATPALAAIAEPTGVQEALRAPAGEQLDFMTQAAGVQVYTCKQKVDDAYAYAWTFVAPEAVLMEGGKNTGKHYAGPHWESLADGSKVKGAVKQRQDGGAGNIPWLLLAGTSEGTGKYAGVTSIQRVATKGGVEPKDGCDASKAGQELRVPYTADYYFYKKK